MLCIESKRAGQVREREGRKKKGYEEEFKNHRLSI